jgi:hypothetical protein
MLFAPRASQRFQCTGRGRDRQPCTRETRARGRRQTRPSFVTHNVDDLLKNESEADVERLRLDDDGSFQLVVAARRKQVLEQSTFVRSLTAR